MTKVAETCGCGAQLSIDDTYHHGNYAYEQIEKWRREHACAVRKSDIEREVLRVIREREDDGA